MNASWVGWALAVAAVAVGYVGYGWGGVLLALSVVVFWLLLQFSRALRALRNASAQPLGSVASAVGLHAKMEHGMRLPQVLRLTGSLGRKLGDDPETFLWTDAGGDTVRVELRDGRVTGWRLERAPAPPGEAGD